MPRLIAALASGMAIVLSVASCGGSTVAPGPGSARGSSHTARTAAPCTGARFGVHKVFPSTAAAGSQYTRYVVTNLSGRACSMSGYPRVVALGAGSRPIGGPARTSSFLPHPGRKRSGTVTIAGHGSASFMVQSFEDGPASEVEDCRPRAVHGDRIVLPGSGRAEPMPSVVRQACAGGTGLLVGPIEAEPSRE